jgi:curved DNA-binding protein CbpA
MVHSDYYRILGISADSSIEEIKKAYRKKARLYHPDINNSPDSKDKFIEATEAYDFLITNYGKPFSDNEYERVVDEWRKYRQDRSRQRAQYYARSSYAKFRNSKYYKSTRILNSSAIIFNFAISVMVFFYTIAGFIFRVKNPLPDENKPPVFLFILLLLLSITLFTVSLLNIKAYFKANKKRKEEG